MFQSTHSLRSATNPGQRKENTKLVSIHALLAECDMTWKGNRLYAKSFNPRTPCGVRLSQIGNSHNQHPFQSTHSLRSATGQGKECPRRFRVSIHALLAECDSYGGGRNYVRNCFNPRTPCGVRPPGIHLTPGIHRFQSTHSLRSATCPHGGGRDRHGFQSTHSLRSATFFIHRYYLTPAVSIHALLAECDESKRTPLTIYKSFNPRTPCGVRHGATPGQQNQNSFNPRTPCGVRRNRLYTLLLNRANHTLRQPP